MRPWEPAQAGAFLPGSLPSLSPGAPASPGGETSGSADRVGWAGLELMGGLEAGVMGRCHLVRMKELGSSTPKSIALCLAQSSSSLIFQSHG